ncbi:hypothetical protein CN918_26905 [Priestia megaterium]|nr:hypothetical protein CN918_26905 [Priestia megaterium]
MSLHEQFIPGRWIDDIDVNDFVNLNRKPFLDEPVFLRNNRDNKHPVNVLRWLNEDKTVDLQFSSFSLDEINELPLSAESSIMKRKIGYSENINDMRRYYGERNDAERLQSRQTTYEIFEQIATSDMNKSLRIGLFKHHPSNYTPMFVFPDIRIVPLYGTKQIIKEKRFFLTKLERYLQTSDWIQQRIAKHKEIEAIKKFEKWAKQLGVNVTKQAETTEEVLNCLYVTLLSVVVENPSISLSLTDIISFIDVFAEKEMQLGLLDEDSLQSMLNEFVQKLQKIRFTLSPMFDQGFPSTPFLFGETIGQTVTKTTYRFLHSLEQFYESPFVLRVVWSNHLPFPLKNLLLSLHQQGIPLSIVSPRLLQDMKNPVLLPFGMHVEGYHEICFHGGGCDLEKALYLALNGGKEITTNTNLSAVTSPLRHDQFTYEEVMNKFQDFLSYTILSYVELMNALCYINDIRHNHPLRSSFISNQPFYSILFGFFNMKEVVHILAAIQHEDYTMERKQQKWVVQIKPNQSHYEGEDVIMTQLVSYIQRELKKIPLYKEAQHGVRFYLNDMYDTVPASEINYDLTLPPEYLKGNFHVNVTNVKLSEAFIRNAFSKNLTEINVSKDTNFYAANGVLFHQNYNLNMRH